MGSPRPGAEGRTRRHERGAECGGREDVVRRAASARTAKSCVPGAPKADANADDAQAHRGGRWQSARLTEEITYKP